MKIISILFLTLIGFYPINELSSCGKVKYTVEENEVSQELKIKRDEIFDEMNEKLSDIDFILLFNSQESLFYLNEQENSSKNSTIVSFIKNIVTKGKYYFNSKNDILLREAYNYSKYTLISSRPSLTKWELLNESKKIGNYTCYKARTTKIKTNDSGIFKYVIEAWYTPQIPSPYGPVEFNSLPGLILELKDTHYTFKVKEISLNHTNIKIEKPTSEHIISEEENVKN